MDSLDQTPVPLVIFGVPFHNVSFEDTLDWIVARVHAGRAVNIATANLDFITQAWGDPELQRLLIDADLVLADGFPIVKLAPFFGPPLKGRVTGSDLTPMLADRAEKEAFSLYGLGSADGVAQRAMDILKLRHPNLKVAGAYSPPFASLLEMDHPAILQRLERAQPDILFVAFGAPKQDKFISMHMRDWKVPVAIGVGGSLDFVTGDQKRAPLGLQQFHLEWLWRICRNPRRLFGRYAASVRFLVSASRQMWRIHRLPDRSVVFQTLTSENLTELQARGAQVEPFHPLGNEGIARSFITRMEEMSQSNIILDLHPTPWLDSLELGALMEVNKRCRANGRRLILYALRPKVRRLLETCHLTDYFDTATRMEELLEILQNLTDHRDGHAECNAGLLTLELPLELTASSLMDFEPQADCIQHELKAGRLEALSIDASQLNFIDSSGLGFLISLKKSMQDKGVPMSILHLADRPRRVFEIARVDHVLLHT